VLSRALNQAIKWNLLTRNPVIATAAPKVESEPAPILTDAQIERVLEAIKGDRLENLYRVLLGLGLRRGEALALLWADVDLEAGTIRIAKALQRSEGKLERGDTKSARAVRTLFLPDYLIDALRDQWARLKAEREQWGMGWKEHGLVFPSEIGTPLEPSNVSNRYWKRVLERAGLSSAFTLHGLRHACASFMIVEGVDPRTVADILGHAKVSTTLNIYAHSNQEAQREALGKVERKRKKG
jgi:integrase